MQGVINPYGAIRDAVTNDAINPRERMIRDEGEAYWENHKKEFVKARDCNYRNVNTGKVSDSYGKHRPDY